MERYRVTVEYVIRSTEKITHAILRQVAARKTETFDLEVKNVFQVAQKALQRLREDYPKASMTGFTCEQLKPVGDHRAAQIIIQYLSEEERETLRHCVETAAYSSSDTPSARYRSLINMALITWEYEPEEEIVVYNATDLGREVAAALGFTGGVE